MKTAAVDHQHAFSSKGNKNITYIAKVYILWAFQINELHLNCTWNKWKARAQPRRKMTIIISMQSI